MNQITNKFRSGTGKSCAAGSFHIENNRASLAEKPAGNTAQERRIHPVLKTLVITLAVATLTAGSSQAFASHKDRGLSYSAHSGSKHRHGNNRRQAFARVLNVTPVYKRVQVRKPHKQCSTVYQHHETTYQGQQYQHHDTNYDTHDETQYDTHYDHYRSARPSNHKSSKTSPLPGTIVGGVIGNKLGGHSGNKRGRLGTTIAGALIGTVIVNESGRGVGSSRNRNNQRHYLTQNGHVRDRFDRGSRRPSGNQGYNDRPSRRPVQRCETRTITTTEERLSGYRVTYRYHGRIYHTKTRQHPGERIAVNVNVRPRY